MSHTDLITRQRYPSDLNPRQWARVSPLLPQPARLGRRRRCDLREILDAINYRWETGCTWRMLPHDFPPWGTVYAYFRAWQRQGVLRTIREALTGPSRRDRQQPASRTDRTVKTLWPESERLDPRESLPPGICPCVLPESERTVS